MFDSNISINSEYVNDNVEKTKTEFCIRTDYGKVNTNTSDGIVESLEIRKKIHEMTLVRLTSR